MRRTFCVRAVSSCAVAVMDCCASHPSSTAVIVIILRVVMAWSPVLEWFVSLVRRRHSVFEFRQRSMLPIRPTASRRVLRAGSRHISVAAFGRRFRRSTSAVTKRHPPSQFLQSDLTPSLHLCSPHPARVTPKLLEADRVDQRLGCLPEAAPQRRRSPQSSAGWHWPVSSSADVAGQ